MYGSVWWEWYSILLCWCCIPALALDTETWVKHICKPQAKVQNYVLLFHKLTFTLEEALTICWGSFNLSLSCCLAWVSVTNSVLFVSPFHFSRGGNPEGWQSIFWGWSWSGKKGAFPSNDCLKTLPRQVSSAASVKEIEKCMGRVVENI